MCLNDWGEVDYLFKELLQMILIYIKKFLKVLLIISSRAKISLQNHAYLIHLLSKKNNN